MSTNEIAKAVKEIRELSRMKEELENEITALQDEIKGHMAAADLFELIGSDYKITWKEVTTTRLDSTALKKAIPDVAALYMKTSTSRRFVIA